MDIILPDVFGFTGFTSLISGFMTFTEETSGNINIDFAFHGGRNQGDLNRKFGIYDLSHGYPRYIRTGQVGPFFIDLFINGFGHTVNGKQNLIRPNPDSFLTEYFEVYQPLEGSDFEDAISIFTEDYITEVLDRNTKNRKSINGMDKIYNFLVKKADEIIETVFSPYGEYTQYEQFLDNPNYWAYRTRKQARNFIRIFLEYPIASTSRDFPNEIRRVFRTGNDGYITLKTSGKKSLSSIYGGNPLFDKGIKIPITFSDLLDLFNPNDLRDFADDALFVIQTAYSNLDFNTYWKLKEEEISNKLITAYNRYVEMFSQTNLGVYYDRTFRINFLVDGGTGIVSTNTISKRFSDIKSYFIEFTPSNPSQLRNAIATMLTYMLALPDTFVDIKLQASKLHFLYADLFSLHTPEYVLPKLVGIFMWDGREGLTRERYDNYFDEFEGIFDHTDQHHLLGFDSSFDDVLSTFTRLFRIRVDRNIDITDLRI